jgi:hypothetical protein
MRRIIEREEWKKQHERSKKARGRRRQGTAKQTNSISVKKMI